MVANVGKQKLMLVADMTPAEVESETHQTPWGKVWTHGADVMATWRRYGFVPPTEYRNDYMFKINREGGNKT
jgi:hypothetical protein